MLLAEVLKLFVIFLKVGFVIVFIRTGVCTRSVVSNSL